MNTITIVIIVIAILFVALAFICCYYKKRMTELEKAETNMKMVEKMTMKQNEALDKSGQKLDAYQDNLLKKNDEMLKKLQSD